MFQYMKKHDIEVNVLKSKFLRTSRLEHQVQDCIYQLQHITLERENN